MSQIALMRPSAAVGLGRSFNAQITVQDMAPTRDTRPANRPPPRPCPRARATSLFTTRLFKPANPLPRINGTTARRTHGSLSACGGLGPAAVRRRRAGARRAPCSRATRRRARARALPGRAAWSGARGRRAQGGCACTASFSSPSNPKRIFTVMSSAGAFRTDDAGNTWQPINRGLHSLPHP